VIVLGLNAVFHDPAAALLVDGVAVAAAEEERFSRRKHGKTPVAFSTWELPEQSMAWCLEHAGVTPADVDAVAYSYDPDLALQPDGDITAAEWEGLRTLYARRAPLFLRTALPGLDPERVRWVPHHVAHAASATFASGFDPCSVLVLDGRGERTSHLAGRFAGGSLEVLATQALPHSLGLLYEELTAHLGFRRSSDEYKVMAMASYGEPAFLDDLRRLVYADGVRDFIQVYLWGDPPYPYPTFNVADSFLVCSVAALILGQWWTGRAEPKLVLPAPDPKRDNAQNKEREDNLAASRHWELELFESEPLGLHASVLLVLGSDRFLPAASDTVEALGVDVMLFDEQAPDFVGALATEVDRFQRHLADEGVTALFAEVFHHRVVHVTAQENGRARADLQEAFDSFEILEVVLIIEIEVR